ncbi:hypothetical protein QOZ80_4AG0313820 [Eleusine coracana subsp. coracana]|nr:hypothetical protein QOZ80_4AG0313820 [Eleusine coracana subsp. coracana]
MSPFGPWADLPPELLLLISNGFGLSLESYCRVRRVCTTWRSALPPPIPSLLTVHVTDGFPTDPDHPMRGVFHLRLPVPVSAFFLPAESSFHLWTIPHGARCVGSSNGWMAVVTGSHWQTAEIFLLNPLTSIKKIPLPTVMKNHDSKAVSKIVSTPNPTPFDYVAVTICDLSSLAYATARDLVWTIVDVAMEREDHLVDLAYADTTDDDSKAYYCVTAHGDVRVLRLPSRRRRNPVVENLDIDRTGLPFDPAAAYASPYDVASKFTRFKRIFFVGGSLYQLWRNTTSTVSWETLGGGRFRMAKDEVFVLKYDPERRPCWDKANDLGGCAVFVGKNNPVVLRPEDAAGVRANCVYWIDEWSRNAPMVFDVTTGTSTVHPSAAKVLNPSCTPACWYFLNDKIMSSDRDRKRRISGEDRGQVSKNQKTGCLCTENK